MWYGCTSGGGSAIVRPNYFACAQCTGHPVGMSEAPNIPLRATTIALIALFDACFFGTAILLSDLQWGWLATLLMAMLAICIHLPVYLMIDALRYRLCLPPWTILPSAAVLAILCPLLIWVNDEHKSSGFTSIGEVIEYGLAIIFLPSLPVGLLLILNYYWARGRRPIGKLPAPDGQPER